MPQNAANKDAYSRDVTGDAAKCHKQQVAYSRDIEGDTTNGLRCSQTPLICIQCQSLKLNCVKLLHFLAMNPIVRQSNAFNWSRRILWISVGWDVILVAGIIVMCVVSLTNACWGCPFSDKGYNSEWHHVSHDGKCHNYINIVNETDKIIVKNERFMTNCAIVWLVFWVLNCISCLVTIALWGITSKLWTKDTNSTEKYVRQDDEL